MSTEMTGSHQHVRHLASELGPWLDRLLSFKSQPTTYQLCDLGQVTQACLSLIPYLENSLNVLKVTKIYEILRADFK
jgi:hypothetical protein